MPLADLPEEFLVKPVWSDPQMGEVLYEADEPIVFTLTTADGQLLLVYVAEAGPVRWWLLSATTPRRVEDLKAGRVTVRDALRSSWTWLAKFGEPTKIWRVDDLESLPHDHLPMAGTPLLPEHEPVFTARAVGQEIVRGSVPASVVGFVAEAVKKAMKSSLDYVLEAGTEGRPTDEYRSLYDLPVQRFAFASFEVSFAAPRQLPDPQVAKAIGLLKWGLEWAGDEASTTHHQLSKDEILAALEAAKHLTPPSTGPIDSVHVAGTWVDAKTIVLERGSRRRIVQELRRLRDVEQYLLIEGHIGEIDRDRLTLTIRDEATEHRCFFSGELLDEAIEVFAEGAHVRASVFVPLSGGRLALLGLSEIK